MNIDKTISITEARRKIFSIATNAARLGSSHYTLTEHGRPKVVVVSARKFQSLLSLEHKRGFTNYHRANTGSSRTADRGPQQYAAGPFFSGYNKVLRMCDTICDGVSYRELDALNEEKELNKAQIYIELIEKYNYPIDAIQIGSYVRIGDEGSRRFMEVDIVVDDRLHDAAVIIFVSAMRFFNDDNEKAFRDLFDVARSFVFEKDKTVHLVHYARGYKDTTLKEKCSVVDFHAYGSFVSWKKDKKKITAKKIPPCPKTKKKVR